MSWVPSPSTRLTASYRDVGSVLAPSPARASALGFSGPPTRQGSFTPNPVSSPTGMSPAITHQQNMAAIYSPSPGHLRGVSPAPTDLLADRFDRYHFTPIGDRYHFTTLDNMPIMAPLSTPPAVDDQLSRSLTGFALPAAGLEHSAAAASPIGSVLAGTEQLPLLATHEEPPLPATQAQRTHSRVPTDTSNDRPGSTALLPGLPAGEAASPAATGAANQHPRGHSRTPSLMSPRANAGPPLEQPPPTPPGPFGLKPIDDSGTVPGRGPYVTAVGMTPAAGDAGGAPAISPQLIVKLNIYWQRSVAFDDQGRVIRRLGGDDLSWGKRFLKNVLGVYHVGVEVHGDEYTFGNYHAPSSRQIGDPSSGVFRHDPQKPGPHCVFNQGVPLGSTTKTRDEAEEICAELGRAAYGKVSYNRYQHNCVDFSRTLAEKLGAGDIPLWCYRGAAVAKLLGWGKPSEQDDSENNANNANEQRKRGGGNAGISLAHARSASSPAGSRQGHEFPVEALTVTNAPLGADTTDAPVGGSTMPELSSVANSLPSANLPPQAATLPAANLPPPVLPPLPGLSVPPALDPVNPACGSPVGGLVVGRPASVWSQSAGQWIMGSVDGPLADGRFRVNYESSVTEVGVDRERIVLHPAVPRETTALAQAVHSDQTILIHPQAQQTAPQLQPQPQMQLQATPCGFSGFHQAASLQPAATMVQQQQQQGDPFRIAQDPFRISPSPMSMSMVAPAPAAIAPVRYPFTAAAPHAASFLQMAPPRSRLTVPFAHPSLPVGGVRAGPSLVMDLTAARLMCTDRAPVA